MSASAILSVTTGGAPLGASTFSTTEAAVSNDGASAFAGLLDAEMATADIGKAAPVEGEALPLIAVNAIGMASLTLEADLAEPANDAEIDVETQYPDAVAVQQPIRGYVAPQIEADATTDEAPPVAPVDAAPEDVAPQDSDDTGATANPQLAQVPPAPIAVASDTVAPAPVPQAQVQADAVSLATDAPATPNAQLSAVEASLARMAQRQAVPSGDTLDAPAPAQEEPAQASTATSAKTEDAANAVKAAQTAAATPLPTGIQSLAAQAQSVRKAASEAATDAAAQPADASNAATSNDGNALKPADAPIVPDANAAAKAPVAKPATVEPTAPDADKAVTALETQHAHGAALDEAAPAPSTGTRLSLATINTTAEIAAQIVRKLGQRTTRFDMVMTPEDLGSVSVSMEVNHDGRMTARLAFDTPQAAAELRARAEELRRQLVEAGFDVAENALEFTDRESDQRGGFQNFMSDSRSGRRAFAGASRLADDADVAVPPVWTSVNLTPTGVDMKV